MKKRKTYGTCSIPGCSSPAVHKHAKLCNACYHWMYYWSNKTPTDVMRRVQQLEFWEKRMKVLMPANVRKLKAK